MKSSLWINIRFKKLVSANRFSNIYLIFIKYLANDYQYTAFFVRFAYNLLILAIYLTKSLFIQDMALNVILKKETEDILQQRATMV